MKKYKLYKKLEPVSFNIEELLSHIILPLIVTSYISYPFFYFLGTTAALVFNIILAAIATYFYNGVKITIPILNNDSAGIGTKTIFYPLATFLIILATLLIVDFGIYLLVLYQKNSEFNIIHFCIWLFILFGLPLFHYLFKSGQYYFKKKQQSLDFLNIILAINHDLDLHLTINNIQFVNTTNLNSSDIKIKNNIRNYSQKEFITANSKTRLHYATNEKFMNLVQIPYKANILLISWFSYNENKYYSLEIPFPIEKFITKQEKCLPNKLKVFKDWEPKLLQLKIYKNGGIKAFHKDTILIDCLENKEYPMCDNDQRKFH